MGTPARGVRRRPVRVLQPGHGLLTEEAAVVLPLVVLVLDHRGGQRSKMAVVGRMPTTLARRSISAFSRSMALVEEIDFQWSVGKVM
jgi:hypothetical protein